MANFIYISKEPIKSLINKYKDTNNFVIFNSLLEGIPFLMKNNTDILIIEIKNDTELIALKKIKPSFQNLEIICLSNIYNINYLEDIMLLKAVNFKLSSEQSIIFYIEELLNKINKEIHIQEQIEELKFLKDTFKNNLPYIKIDQQCNLLYANDLFKNLGISFNKFCYENEKDKFYSYINKIKSELFISDTFFFKKDDSCLKFSIDFILEKNKNDTLILILKDITKEHFEQKNVKSHLLKKNSNIFLKSKEDNAITISKLEKIKKENRELKEHINVLNLKLKELESKITTGSARFIYGSKNL